MGQYNTGKVIRIRNVENFAQAAEEWAEGNEALHKLLIDCHERGIETMACCGGHYKEGAEFQEVPYIAFVLKTGGEGLFRKVLSRLNPEEYSVGVSVIHQDWAFWSVREMNMEADFTEMFRKVDEAILEYGVAGETEEFSEVEGAMFGEAKGADGEVTAEQAALVELAEKMYRGVIDLPTDKQAYVRSITWDVKDGKFESVFSTKDEKLVKIAKKLGYKEDFMTELGLVDLTLTGEIQKGAEILRKLGEGYE